MPPVRRTRVPRCAVLRELRQRSRGATAVSSAEGPHGACPRCCAPASPEQEYCLECGLRLPFTDSRLRAGRPWYAAPALWSLLALLLLAAIGTAVAVAVTNGEEEQTLTATAPPARAPATTAVSTPEATTTAPATTPPLPGTTSPPPGSAQQRPIDWPDRDGYTIVLESIPTSSSRQRAVDTARKAIRAGLADVGVLASSNYPSLQPGYYVVFTGVYDSTSEAVDALAAASDAGFQAYVRPVSR